MFDTPVSVSLKGQNHLTRFNRKIRSNKDSSLTLSLMYIQRGTPQFHISLFSRSNLSYSLFPIWRAHVHGPPLPFHWQRGYFHGLRRDLRQRNNLCHRCKYHYLHPGNLVTGHNNTNTTLWSYVCNLWNRLYW